MTVDKFFQDILVKITSIYYKPATTSKVVGSIPPMTPVIILTPLCTSSSILWVRTSLGSLDTCQACIIILEINGFYWAALKWVNQQGWTHTWLSVVNMPCCTVG